MKLISKNKKLQKKTVGSSVKNGCLECSGNLVPYDEMYVLELFGKEVFSIGKRRGHVYQCSDCNNTFLPSAKYHTFLNDKERADQVNSNNDIYARLMVASLDYTANIDGKFSNKEDELLEMVLKEAKDFPSTKGVLQKVFDLGNKAESYVFSIFDFAKQHLSRERLESVVIANARMILVDGKIKKSESKLLNKYLRAAGLSIPLETVLSKAHTDQYKGGTSKVGL